MINDIYWKITTKITIELKLWVGNLFRELGQIWIQCSGRDVVARLWLKIAENRFSGAFDRSFGQTSWRHIVHILA